MIQGTNLWVQVTFSADATDKVTPGGRLVECRSRFFDMIIQSVSNVGVLVEQTGGNRRGTRTRNYLGKPVDRD